MKKIILGLALLGSLAFGETQFQSLRKQYEQKCKAGNLEACGDAGAFYKLPTKFGGNSSDRDYKKVLYYYKKACDGNVYMICSDLGAMYEDGEGVKKDYKKAIELYNKACDGGVVDGCSNLGYMYTHDKGVKRDMTRAMGYFRRACDAGSWVACGNFASVLEAGGDRVRAAQYYQKAYELGKKDSPSLDHEKDYLRKYCDKYDILK
ncbi:tetratricopeptide repeat protein [uncultured Campylobacter sp.]|uniref:tetratricopeptide repeat protein n=1 Tax=uncultured Campylobacter sp. TaxID=218934 RepID=UPI00260DFAAB|nr:tetratricopeptide repeat protein [uncultured Campylobacter sp.]